MKNKKFRLFAGPNGSGKSTLIKQVSQNFNIGYFINADNIEQELNKKGYLDLERWVPGKPNSENWEHFLTHTTDPRINQYNLENFKISDNFLVSSEKVNSYQAAFLAEFFRSLLVESNHTFSFETVMSHTSKIQFLKKAKQMGFTTYLYFICTQDPSINQLRVQNRVVKGGHNVDNDKIVKRYHASLELLVDAFTIADRAYVIDSSNENRDVILEKKNKSLEIHSNNIPDWVEVHLLNKLKLA